MSTERLALMSYNVTAKRWARGWELHIDDIGVTQCRTLDSAQDMVRDYLRLDGYEDYSTADVVINVYLDGLEREVDAVHQEAEAAAEAQKKAGEHARELATALRDQGLSVTDTATVLGVSRGRVSQLVAR
jgi:DNA-directed RNA polymerase specialized sigma subunit